MGWGTMVKGFTFWVTCCYIIENGFILELYVHSELFC